MNYYITVFGGARKDEEGDLGSLTFIGPTEDVELADAIATLCVSEADDFPDGFNDTNAEVITVNGVIDSPTTTPVTEWVAEGHNEYERFEVHAEFRPAFSSPHSAEWQRPLWEERQAATKVIRERFNLNDGEEFGTRVLT